MGTHRLTHLARRRCSALVPLRLLHRPVTPIRRDSPYVLAGGVELFTSAGRRTNRLVWWMSRRLRRRMGAAEGGNTNKNTQELEQYKLQFPELVLASRCQLELTCGDAPPSRSRRTRQPSWALGSGARRLDSTRGAGGLEEPAAAAAYPSLIRERDPPTKVYQTNTLCPLISWRMNIQYRSRELTRLDGPTQRRAWTCTCWIIFTGRTEMTKQRIIINERRSHGIMHANHRSTSH